MVDLNCYACGQIHVGAKPVTLHDGHVVGGDSEAWRAECEARYVVNLPRLQDRRKQLALVTKIRGERAGEALRSLVWLLFKARDKQ